MKLPYKMLLAMAGLVLLTVVGVCGWLFLYTGDLPDVDHLSQFAPSTESVVSDSCLASPSTSIPFDQLGEPLTNALAAAEPADSLSDQIARSLLCNHSGGMGRYHLNAFRLSWHIRMHFSEHQLFLIYANRAYFGAGITGVARASKEFFHKEPEALSTEQAALIAGLLRAPEYFSPYKYPERALQRRNKVLEKMVVQGKLSAADAVRLEATPVVTQPSQSNSTPAIDNCGLTAYPVTRSTREILAAVPLRGEGPSNSTMLAKVAIDPEGRVTHLRVMRLAYPGASNADALNEQAADSIKRWHYAPTTVAGKPVTVCSDVAVTIDLGKD